MKDLVIFKNDSFVKPVQITQDEQQMITQAYIALFLTKIESVVLEPTLGVNLDLGKRNIIDAKFMIDDINYNIVKQIKEEYNISSYSIENITTVDDTIKFTVILNNDITIDLSY